MIATWADAKPVAVEPVGDPDPGDVKPAGDVKVASK
jgi:hypothetical protein